MRPFACPALVLALLLSVVPKPSVAAPLHVPRDPIPGRYIVVLKEHAARLSGERRAVPDVATAARAKARRHGARLDRHYDHVVRGFVVEADARVLARLLSDPDVAFVQQDAWFTIAASQTPATWGIDRIDQRELPLDATYTYATTGQGVHAYVVDSGIMANHVQFGGRVGNGFTAIADGLLDQDCVGHGTHVAGTIGGLTTGVAKGVTLHSVRVLGCDNKGSTSGIAAGLDWVAGNHVKPAVVNASLGAAKDPTLDLAVERLVQSGVTVVVAAGNDNADACNVSPARAPSAITVAATAGDDQRIAFSNHGACVDLFAPGLYVTSAWNTSVYALNAMSGTSMAAPHVTGVAARYLGTHPAATPEQVTQYLLENATAGRVGDVKGSPNLLLYAPPLD